MTHNDFDIAIVGGGPAGLSTALFLRAKHPTLRVAVLEKKKYPRDKICAGAVGRRADRALATIGVHVDVPSVPVYGMSIASQQSVLVARRDEPIGRVVRRIEFDAALAKHVDASGAQLFQDAGVTSIARADRGLSLETSQGRFTCRALVGADGVGSFVRKWMGLGRGEYYAQAVEVDLFPKNTATRPQDLLHFDITDRALTGYTWDFPTPVHGDVARSWGAYALRTIPGSETVHGALGALTKNETPLGPSRRYAERGLATDEPMSAPSVVLVGEAAGIDPVLGEGIAQAICSGPFAADYVAKRIKGGAFGFEDYRSRFNRSKVGIDLAVRTRAASFIYGQTRPWAERWVTRSQALAAVGMQYFGGVRMDRKGVAKGLYDLAKTLPPMWDRS